MIVKLLRIPLFLMMFLFLGNAAVIAQESGSETTSNPGALAIVVAFLIAAPFVILMLTSYVKVAVVMAVLRNAVGAGQIPPTHVVTGISLIVTLFIMAPVAEKMYAEADGFDETSAAFSEASVKSLIVAAVEAREPLRKFLSENAGKTNKSLFVSLAKQLAVKNDASTEIEAEHFKVLIPAFLVTQLTEAFQIGFLLFLPFLIIDLVVSNILHAMGFIMLPPPIVSLPFKLLLFVLIDGWALLIQNLITGYV